MKTIKCKLTVYFAEPFWVGVFERICDGKLSVAKVTFGAEPKDYDIQEFVLNCRKPLTIVGDTITIKPQFQSPLSRVAEGTAR